MANARPHRRIRPEELEEPAKSVLAVLLVAALWPARFEGGWVTVDDFRRYGFYLRHRNERESLKATIRAAQRDFRRLTVPIEVRSERSDVWVEDEARTLREDHRRLHGGVAVPLWIWLLGDGARCLEPGLRREFHQFQFQPMASVDEVLAGLEDTVIRTLLSHGHFDQAIERARRALGEAASARARQPLALALATALIRRGRPEDGPEAEHLLEELYAHLVAPLDHADLLVHARARISLAYSRFVLRIRGVEPPTPRHHQLVKDLLILIGEAESIATDLSLSDQGQVANLRGLICKWEAQVSDDADERTFKFEEAERYIRQALTLWRLAQDSYGLGVSLYNLGELAFARYELHRGFGEEAHIQEALVWYDASAQLTTALGALEEWFLDYAKAAECLALLIPHYAQRTDWRACAEAAHRAHAYLDRGAARVDADSLQGRLFARVRRLLKTTWAKYSPPLAPLADLLADSGTKAPRSQ